MSLEERAARYRALIEDELRAIVGRAGEPLFAWMRYHLGWEDESGVPAGGSGKMLRPVALLLAAELTGGGVEQAAPAAAAVELVHGFSLLHDDIEDASATRRGRETLWRIAGVPHAINTGDGMFALARLAMHRLADRGLSQGRIIEAMRELDETCLRLVEGQYLDMSFEQRDDVTPDEYMAMAAGKTAAMFAAPFAIGAILGGADAQVVEAYRAFGYHTGLAFQAIDDVLGIWGDQALTGKPVGDDLRTRKMTYPVLAALDAGGEQSDRLARRYAEPARDDEIDMLTALIERLGGRDATERLAEEQGRAALAALDVPGIEDAARAMLSEFERLAVARVA